MTIKLQAVRFKLQDGREHVFIGPAAFHEAQSNHGIEAIDFSGQFECEDSAGWRDLVLLVQGEGSVH